ncbi:GNAT family N-acetyltransferase [Cribrihabitans neustonicus]|uniref:GNAT family N-acetyltransferase n=1 Tax=Cribrihabitans neustonicus TaxID=1429085 RepID=UPI003B5BD4C8
MPMVEVRKATLRDAAGMAEIINGWIDRTEWMRRDLPAEDFEALFVQGLEVREIWAAGDPIEGYLSLDPESSHIWGFHCAQPGQGTGKLLLDRAKEGRSFLSLNTHVPNTGAQRFYRREGFRPVQAGGTQSAAPGRGNAADPAIPEMRMEWHR